MGQLANLRPRLGRLEPKLRRQTDAEGHSTTLEPWRAWYKTRAWRELKDAVHRRDLFTCQCGCGKVIANSAERIADHKKPHRGSRELFFDPANVWTLWKPHHDGWKQRLERAERGRGG